MVGLGRPREGARAWGGCPGDAGGGARRRRAEPSRRARGRHDARGARAARRGDARGGGRAADRARGPRSPCDGQELSGSLPVAQRKARRRARRGRHAAFGRAGAGRAGGLGGEWRRGRPVRRRHQRRGRGRSDPGAARRRDRARPPGPAALRGGPHVADRPARAGTSWPGGGGRPGRRGPDARPLSAVLRIRDRGRVRRHALGRSGVGRIRALRRAGHSDRADEPQPGGWPRWRLHTPPPAPRSASWSSGPRGRSA